MNGFGKGMDFPKLKITKKPRGFRRIKTKEYWFYYYFAGS